MSFTYQDLLDRARSTINEIGPYEARELAAGGATIIDVRERDEVDQGQIEGAIHIARGSLESSIEQAIDDRNTPIIVYCASGQRSALAAKTLQELGYTNVASLGGGFQSWKSGGLDWETPHTLTASQRRRYSRHLLLPEIGDAGQHRLLDARILLVGAGGLGSPAAIYLAAAGVGTLGIIDEDVVDESNLQRQMLHTTDRIGASKVESARATIEAINPQVTVIEHPTRLTKENALELIGSYDLVIDGADNFPTRYLINDACVLLEKANVHGGVARFDGQLTIFSLPEGPCYRCLFREPPPPGMALNCAEAGVLGVLPGAIGLLQATEAMKLVLGIGRSLIGRLLVYDALEMTVREIRLRKDPTCPMCGPNGPTSLNDIEYSDISCAIGELVPTG
jgi:sulfur-carrier protein adenylyltransferase/sulfurtransferase